MKPARKKRMLLISGIFLLVATAVALVLFAMRQDLNHYYSLAQIATKQVPIEQVGIRVGGMVEAGSLHREGESLNIRFKITDFKNPSLEIRYAGILPDLFREGQGVIAKGKLGSDGVFHASEILAKHDENYMPPEVRADMDSAGHSHQSGQGN